MSNEAAGTILGFLLLVVFVLIVVTVFNVVWWQFALLLMAYNFSCFCVRTLIR